MAQQDYCDLECSICQDIYRDPRLLPCFHSYCLKCLRNLVRTSQESKCPKCRKHFSVPREGVAKFQKNMYLSPAVLERARDSQACRIHPNKSLNLYCADCKEIFCITCILADHRSHTFNELETVAQATKDPIATNEQKRIEDAVANLSDLIDLELAEKSNIKAKKRALKHAVRERHAVIVAMADKFRDEALSSLTVATDEIQSEVSKRLISMDEISNKLYAFGDQLKYDVTSGNPNDLQQTFNETLKLKTNVVKRPVLTFCCSVEFLRQKVTEIWKTETRTLSMCTAAGPPMSVKRKKKYGKHKNTSVFCICPKDNGVLWVSYAEYQGMDEAPPLCFKGDGSVVQRRHGNKLAGKISFKPRQNGKHLQVPYQSGKWISTYSKSPSNSILRLSYDERKKMGYVYKVQVIGDDPFHVESTALFSLSLPGPQRAFDVDHTQQLFVVLEEAQGPDKRRRVHLYHLLGSEETETEEEGEAEEESYEFSFSASVEQVKRKAVATYTPPSPLFQPSDICFVTLESRELLLVADEGTDTIHVLKVEPGALTFLYYLAPGNPEIVRPTALNTDCKGRLWVACRKGTIVRVREKKKRQSEL